MLLLCLYLADFCGTIVITHARTHTHTSTHAYILYTCIHTHTHTHTHKHTHIHTQHTHIAYISPNSAILARSLLPIRLLMPKPAGRYSGNNSYLVGYNEC